MEGSELTKDEWRQLFINHYGDQKDYFGHMVLDKGNPVGFLGYFFSERLINNKIEKFCNMTTWIVKKEYRGQGLGKLLLQQVIALKDYTITDLTAAIGTVPMIKKYGFNILETKYKIILPMPNLNFLSSQCVLELTPAIIENQLNVIDKKYYRDHQKNNCLHLLLKVEEEYCYLIVKKARWKKMRFAQIHYLSNLDLFLRHVHQIRNMVCWPLHVFGFMVEERFLRGKEIKYSLNGLCTGKFFKSNLVDKKDITDNLYTEILLLNI